MLDSVFNSAHAHTHTQIQIQSHFLFAYTAYACCGTGPICIQEQFLQFISLDFRSILSYIVNLAKCTKHFHRVYMVYYTISQTNEFKGQTLRYFLLIFAFVPTTQQGTRTRTRTHTHAQAHTRKRNFFENAVKFCLRRYTTTSHSELIWKHTTTESFVVCGTSPT